MTVPFDILCVGAATLDRIAVVERMPGEDTRVVSEPLVTAGGGPAATAAVTAARLGARVAFCGVVGTDAAGDLISAQLAAEGVDTRWLLQDPSVPTTESMIVVVRERGTRTIITTPSRAPEAASIPVDQTEWVHVDQTGFAAVREALASERAPRPRLSVDAGNRIDDLDLSGVDLYAPTVSALTSSFPAETVGGSLIEARASGAGIVVATDGDAGSLFLDGDAAVSVPAFPVDPVSTMGAGDVFHGALLAGLVSGRDLPEAVRFANAVAALSCRALDGRGGIPTREEAEAQLTGWSWA